jgi:hypothetical protein
MMSRKSIIIAFMLITTIFATIPTPVSALNYSGFINGTVLKYNGDPADHATVSISWEGGPSSPGSSTDDNGHYSIPVENVLRYSYVSITATYGDATGSLQFMINGNPSPMSAPDITVIGPAETTDHPIRGYVINTNGDGVGGATVTIIQAGSEELLGSNTTGETGYYYIPLSVAIGTLTYVNASLNNYFGELEVIMFDGTFLLEDIVLHQGPVAPPPPPPPTLTVSVVDEYSQNVAGAAVRITHNGTTQTEVSSNHQPLGTASFTVSNGTYSIEVSKTSYSTKSTTVNIRGINVDVLVQIIYDENVLDSNSLPFPYLSVLLAIFLILSILIIKRRA